MQNGLIIFFVSLEVLGSVNPDVLHHARNATSLNEFIAAAAPLAGCRNIEVVLLSAAPSL